MSTVLKLDPENAVQSIAARLATIAQCETYIRETVDRYDGLRAFEDRLTELGISEATHAIAGKE